MDVIRHDAETDHGVILMKVQEIRTLAKGRGLKPGRLAKTDLVRMLQKEEGNFDCFGKAGSHCDHLECKYHKWCLSLSNLDLNVENYNYPPC